MISFAVASATNDLADRQVFALTPDTWEAPRDPRSAAGRQPKIAALLSGPSIP